MRAVPLLVCLLLAGCAERIPGWKIDVMSEKCATRGGIHEIDSRLPIDAVCRDGTRVTPYKEVKS